MRTMGENRGQIARRIVAAVALCLCAAGLDPAVAAELPDGKLVRAQADLKSIQVALDRFKADYGLWPTRVDGAVSATATVEVLFSEGGKIASPGTWPVDNPLVYKQLAGYFVDNDRNYPPKKWKGPYLKETADPWGNTYLVGVRNLEKSLPVWIISAGPDGILQTPMDSPVCMDGRSADPGTGLTTVGDDICLKYK
jgi:Type II secretion system (T2SS), protein G